MGKSVDIYCHFWLFENLCKIFFCHGYSSFSFFYSCLFLIHICDLSRRSFGIEYKGHPHCIWIFQQIVFVNLTWILLYRQKDNCLMFIHGKILLLVASVLDSWLIQKHLYLYSKFLFMIL